MSESSAFFCVLIIYFLQQTFLVFCYSFPISWLLVRCSIFHIIRYVETRFSVCFSITEEFGRVWYFLRAGGSSGFSIIILLFFFSISFVGPALTLVNFILYHLRIAYPLSQGRERIWLQFRCPKIFMGSWFSSFLCTYIMAAGCLLYLLNIYMNVIAF